ncbi:MAG: P-loop NTPase fold protein, partial [Candidatus Dadabacteria bacterium]|nr:P-loop NTPase fold protein [Candidatus Dadabacteria bacterium]
MGIRIRPREIDITEEEPFKNDLLNRKESVEVLTHLVESIEGPCVLAVDAAWGRGKTTFLAMWAHHLRKMKFPVVEFNAWETDFSGDPFIALSIELAEGVKNNPNKKDFTEKIDSMEKISKQLLKLAVSGAIRFLTSGILDIDPLLEKQSGHVPQSSTENRLNEYLDAKECIKEFKRVLQDLAVVLSESHENRPLIVVIDELDRCRPSYAVELLEVVKHLFEVDHIVFVLAINRSELAHSVRALYGSGFDADNYLRRFFDFDFQLPEPGRREFIDSMIEAVNIREYFERTLDKNVDVNILPFLMQAFFGDPDLSLRTIAQAIHRLGLVFASLRRDQWSFIPMAVVLLIIRTIDSDLYYKFIRGKITDSEVVKTVFDRPGVKDLQWKREGYIFEAVVILGAHERDNESILTTIQSPLY